MGHPILRKIAKRLTLDDLLSDEVQRLIDNMVKTMREMNGAGLAAPQVHESLQILVIEVKNSSRYPDKEEISLHILINPKIIYKSKEIVSDFEGCLSIDRLRAKVPRHKEIHLKALDRFGEEILIKNSGFLAIALQHEIDHLEGKLFLDHVVEYELMTQEKEFYEYHC
jgi:peptide deformylase